MSGDRTTGEPRRTTLYETHVQLGARMIDFAGWEMPVWYDSAIDEHHRVRQAAGLFDLGHMAELVVSGPDSAVALDHALLVDASAMDPGRARYTMIVNEAGGIIDDLIVYRLATERFMVVANASNGPAVMAALVDRSADFDARVLDHTEEWALVAVQGPNSVAAVQPALGSDLDLAGLKYYRVLDAEFDGGPVLVARTGYTGELGFELFIAADRAADLWQALTDAGSGSGLAPIGLAARDTLRLEAGMPLYGNELSLDTTPFDVGAARLVDADRQDYVGAQALAEAGNRPAASLVGLIVDGRRPARAGYEVHDSSGNRIGTITSGAPSPTLDANIAIASIGASAEVSVGDTVRVQVRSVLADARVVDLPFYRRPG